jgi:hypothetical protein
LRANQFRKLPGIFKDSDNQIEGDCGPVLIHADKSKNKEAEKKERSRQRNGEAPSEITVTKRFKEGTEGVPEILVSSTNSGSMTPEDFYQYVEHFVASLPKDHGPVILFLDGHSSRWSVPALRYLMDHQVYPFFIASHTFIWAQPNDCGVNKRFHWAIEQAARKERRNPTPYSANLAYFNRIFAQGWKHFITEERQELRELGYNNTTNAHQRTGIEPFNPFATSWTEAMETLGMRYDDNDPSNPEPARKIQYEVVAINGTTELSEEESKVLRQGLLIHANSNDNDHAIALR